MSHSGDVKLGARSESHPRHDERSPLLSSPAANSTTGSYLLLFTITTIGYGDIVPHTTVGRILTAFYALGTIIFLGSMINLLIDAINERIAAAEAAAEKAYVDSFSKSDTPAPSPASADITHRSKSTLGVWYDTVWKFFVFGSCVLFGTIFYATYENCVCSYGLDFKKGCVDTSFEMCVLTGGYVKTWLDSFYMVIITLTTIGFGDFCPMSYLGRVLWVPWAFVGVISMANAATSFGAALSQATTPVPPQKTRVELKQDLIALCGNRDQLSLAEFSWFLLQQNDRINEHSASLAALAFDRNDWAREGQVSHDDAAGYVHMHMNDDC